MKFILLFGLFHMLDGGFWIFFIHYFGTTPFIVDMLIYMVAFYFLLGLDIPSLAQKSVSHVFEMIRSGYVYLRQNPKIVHLILLHASVGCTAYDALIALLADYQYKHLLSISLRWDFINASRRFIVSVRDSFS